MEEDCRPDILEFSISITPANGVPIPPSGGTQPPSFLSINNFRFDRVIRRLFRLDKLYGTVKLEVDPKALDVLEVLLKHPYEWVPKADIMTAVWGRVVEDAALYVQIYNLRKKLGQKRKQLGQRSCIQVKSSHGYRLLATLKPLETEDSGISLMHSSGTWELIPNDRQTEITTPIRLDKLLERFAGLVVSALQNSPGDGLTDKLIEVAGACKEQLASAEQDPDDGRIAAEIERALRDAMESGELRRADQLLSQLQQVQETALMSKYLQRASTSARRGQLAISQLRYQDSARHFADAAKHVPWERMAIQQSYRLREADALCSEGGDQSDNLVLTLALDRYRILLSLLSYLVTLLTARECTAPVADEPEVNLMPRSYHSESRRAIGRS